MFNFFFAADYEDRKVDNTVLDDGTEVDTCYVNDGHQPYETAVAHPQYNEGKWVIVEAYDTKDQAQDGHDRWINLMASDKRPSILKDCSNSFIQSFLDQFEDGEE